MALRHLYPDGVKYPKRPIIRIKDKMELLRIIIAPVLALLLIVGTLLVFILVLFIEVANDKLLYLILGSLTSLATTVTGYYFGSSEGSAKKTDLLARSSNGKTE